MSDIIHQLADKSCFLHQGLDQLTGKGGLLHQALGLVAGGIVTFAACPRVIGIYRNPSKAKGESYSRNALLMSGNLVLIAYAWGDSFAVMATLNSALNGFILWAAIRANRQPKPDKMGSPAVLETSVFLGDSQDRLAR